MLNNPFIDFYRGWMIEVINTTDGCWSFYHSPDGEKLSDQTVYPHLQDAQQAAIQLIDRFFTCYALSDFLREMYELSQLGFEEWHQLNGSLIECSRSQFVQSSF